MRFIDYILRTAALCGAIGLASGCIDRGIPQPDVNGEIVAMVVAGEMTPAVITPSRRTVEIELGEGVDPADVKVSRLELTTGGWCDVKVGDRLDLSSPKTVTVRTVSTYEWTISATQRIEYRFEVAGILRGKKVSQVGKSYIEEHSHSAFAFVPRGTDLEQITITALKLWPEGAEGVTISPENVREGAEVSFTPSTPDDPTVVKRVEVSYRGVVTTWWLYVTESSTRIEEIDPFAFRVKLSGVGAAGEECGFEYRAANDAGEEWTRVESEGGADEEGSFHATVTELTPSTDYLVRAFSAGSVGSVEEFSTTGTRPLPGGGFDEWHKGVDPRNKIKNSAWSPWREGTAWEVDRWWDTGNKGVAIVNQSLGGNSLPTPENEGCPDNPTGRAAKLETKIAISTIIAGGNLYFGEFGSMTKDILNATCRIGHNWSDSKPTKLKGWFKYSGVAINNVSEPHLKVHPLYMADKTKFGEKFWMGKPDSLNICVALWASPDGRDIPFTVNSYPAEFVDFSREQPGVIAFGAFVSAATQSEWGTFEVPIEYLKAGPLPRNTQLYILATASKHCNYFIAGAGSVLWVDEFKLEYD